MSVAATLSLVVATKTVRPARIKILYVFYRKKGFPDFGSRRSLCEVPWELQGRRADLGSRVVGGATLQRG